MSTLAAIETTYAGCRFRSRLEARWAVFFDALRIEWLYEPQGYTVGPDATPYLPDFYLPGMGLWVEVKGKLGQAELETLIWAAGPAGLPLNPTTDQRPREFFPWRRRMLVLGDIPNPGTPWLHTRIDGHAGDVVARQRVLWWPFPDGEMSTVEVFGPSTLNQYVAGRAMEAGDLRWFTAGLACPLLTDPHPRIVDAYRAARAARFEHGESGA